MRNPVAKNIRTFNKPSVQRDRKKDQKRGYKKHKNRANDHLPFVISLCYNARNY